VLRFFFYDYRKERRERRAGKIKEMGEGTFIVKRYQYFLGNFAILGVIFDASHLI
jgi:hypothetical protein